MSLLRRDAAERCGIVTLGADQREKVCKRREIHSDGDAIDQMVETCGKVQRKTRKTYGRKKEKTSSSGKKPLCRRTDGGCRMLRRSGHQKWKTRIFMEKTCMEEETECSLQLVSDVSEEYLCTGERHARADRRVAMCYSHMCNGRCVG